jgi:hypothetical protein
MAKKQQIYITKLNMDKKQQIYITKFNMDKKQQIGYCAVICKKKPGGANFKARSPATDGNIQAFTIMPKTVDHICLQPTYQRALKDLGCRSWSFQELMRKGIA